jgi:hypothetical protein
MGNLNSLPVLLIAFNRPTLTKANLQMISKFKPEKLFFSLDGPRKNSVEDLINVNLCKDLIQDLNWKCKLFTNFSASNFGSGIWPYESINWAFNHVEKLLVIEDDVLISEDFYRESNNLLNQFKEQKNIFAICASNISDLDALEQSNEIFYSKYFSGWGWATWKDRWEDYYFEINAEPKMGFLKLLSANNGNVIISLYFLFNFYLIKRGKLQAWDYQINHLLFSSDRFVIKFKKNLSSNLGFGNDATHTKYLPTIKVNNINGAYGGEIQAVIATNEEKRWRKSRIKFIVKSWLLRMQIFEKNTTR